MGLLSKKSLCVIAPLISPNGQLEQDHTEQAVSTLGKEGTHYSVCRGGGPHGPFV